MNSTEDAAEESAKTLGIQYAECPHCHHDVMVRPDHMCLACGKDQSDTTGADPNVSMVTIENVSKIPACCFMCGVDTERLQTFSWAYRTNPFGLPPWMLPISELMSHLPGSQYGTTEKLRLPTCKACAKKAKAARPLSIWSGLDCRLLVHRIFRERFEALNGRAHLDLEWEAETRVCGAPKHDEKIFTSGVGSNLKG